MNRSAASEHRSLFLPCRCIGTCGILSVDDWGDALRDPAEPWNWTFDFYTRTGGGTSTLLYRIKLAWNILLGRDHHLDAVCLDGSDVRKLQAFLAESMPERAS